MRTEYFMEQNFRNELNQAIDFSSVLTQVSAFSSFSCAKEKILNALPVFDKLEIQEQLNYAKEAIQFDKPEAYFLYQERMIFHFTSLKSFETDDTNK